MSQDQGLHIGYLVQQFPPEVGAGPARVSEMALRWLAAGARVSVFTAMPNRPEGVIQPEYRGKLFVTEAWQGIQVYRSWLFASPRRGFARTLLNNLTFMIGGGLAALRHGRDLDVLIASSPPFFPHIAGRVAALFWRVPLVLEIRDLWPDYLVGMGVLKPGVLSRALFALERRLLRSAARVVVVTESFRGRIELKGVMKQRVELIPNGVDTFLYFRAEEPAPLAALERQGDGFIVGYLGNFGAGQGLDAVVDAAVLLAREDPEIRLVLAGDGPEREHVRQRAAALALDTLAISPPIPKERTRAFYNSCDACLVPLAPFAILQETVPSKLFEVMACERPVIACLGGEGERIVQESGAGVTCAPGDPRAIADAVRRIKAMSEAERSEAGRAGRAYVTIHYSREMLAARYLALLEELG